MKTKIILLMTILIASSFVVGQAFAQTTVLSLIHESEAGEDNFWWKGSTPVFTDLDKELASSFRRLSVKLIQPEKSVSRVYRTTTLNEEKAKTVGSLFGAENVLYGRLELSPLENVASQKGVQAILRVSLLGNYGTNTQTFSAVAYGSDPARLRIIAKRIITNQLANFVSWASVSKNAGEVGYALSNMDLFLEQANADLISKLREQFTLNKARVRPIWASESGIALRVSGVAPSAIPRIVERIRSEDIEVEIGRKDQGLIIKRKK